MENQVVLLLLGVFTSTVFSAGLKCYNCSSQTSQSCTKVCPDNNICVSMAIMLQTADINLDYSNQDCMPKDFCLNGAMSSKFSQASINSTCCSTDLCNKPIQAASLTTKHNGKKCCSSQDCSDTVDCVGDEDFCYNSTVLLGSFNLKTKGCATESVCNKTTAISTPSNFITSVTCCKGDFCNGVDKVTLSFLLMMVPLLSFILVH